MFFQKCIAVDFLFLQKCIADIFVKCIAGNTLFLQQCIPQMSTHMNIQKHDISLLNITGNYFMRCLAIQMQ